jgi:hypothetical protein
VDGCAGIEAAGEGDTDFLADGKMFKDVGHVSILSDQWSVVGDQTTERGEGLRD